MRVELGDLIVLKGHMMNDTYYGCEKFVAGMRLINNQPLKVIDVYDEGAKFFVSETTYVYTSEMVDKIIKPIFKDVVESSGGSTPSQYGIPQGTNDLQDLIEHRNMSFSLGNIFKACYRLGFKSNARIYELNKIKWFVERLIKQEEGREKIGDFKL